MTRLDLIVQRQFAPMYERFCLPLRDLPTLELELAPDHKV